MRLRVLSSALLGGVFLYACAAQSVAVHYEPGARDYFAFRIGLGERLATATDIRFSFSDLGSRAVPNARFNGGVFGHWRDQMTIPEFSEVSWRTPDGVLHAETVPVRERINETLRGKSVLFRIQPDHVEAFVASPTSSGEKLRRFH